MTITRRETTATILARVEEKIEAIRADLQRAVKRLDDHHADHESRIRKLEAYKQWLIGLSAATVTGATALIAWLKGVRS